MASNYARTVRNKFINRSRNGQVSRNSSTRIDSLSPTAVPAVKETDLPTLVEHEETCDRDSGRPQRGNAEGALAQAITVAHVDKLASASVTSALLTPIKDAPPKAVKPEKWTPSKPPTAVPYPTIPLTAYTKKTKYTFNTLNKGSRTISGVPLDWQQPGAIVWHWSEFLVDSNTIRQEGDRVFKKPDGSEWCQKGRSFLITHRSEYKVIECPIYTHGDQGLVRKPQESWHEYCSVQPKDFKDEDFRNQSPENPVLKVGRLAKGEVLQRTTMVVRLSEPMTRDLDVPQLKYYGALTMRSRQAVDEVMTRLMARK